MSRQHKREFGRQEFRSYPLITLRPPPDPTLADYVRSALDDPTHLGTRVKFPRRNCVRRDGESYLFWENFQQRSRSAAPPLGLAPVDFQRYTSCHDDWLFHFRDNLRLHNDIKKFERRQADDVRRRLELGERVEPVDIVRNYETKKKKKEMKICEEPPAAKRKMVVCGLRCFEDYPANPDRLPPVSPPEAKPRPEHIGWTHSDAAESWFLEDTTPSLYQEHADFYQDCYRKRLVWPHTGDRNAIC